MATTTLVKRTAYLVAHFRVTKGSLKFLGTGVYSEPARSLTGGIGRNVFAADVMETSGTSFAEALEQMKEAANMPHIRAVFGWAFDAIRPRGDVGDGPGEL